MTMPDIPEVDRTLSVEGADELDRLKVTATVCKTGLQAYRLPDGSLRYEHLPEWTLDSCARSCRFRPVYRNPPTEPAYRSDEPVVGTVTKAWIDNDQAMHVTIALSDESLAAEIQSGKRKTLNGKYSVELAVEQDDQAKAILIQSSRIAQYFTIEN